MCLNTQRSFPRVILGGRNGSTQKNRRDRVHVRAADLHVLNRLVQYEKTAGE